MLPNRTVPGLSGIGSVSEPANGKIEVTGVYKEGPYYRLDLKLSKARVPITDATTSGSHGTLKLFTFDEQAISFLGSRQDYTSYIPDGTGVPIDTVFEIGVGSAAIGSAADGTLGNGVNEDIGQAVSQTLSGDSGTTTGTAVTASTTAINGTATAATLNLNVSGSAATVDDDGWLAVTGTISVNFAFMGDD